MTYSEILQKLTDRIIEVNPANNLISAQNKAMYDSAVNYFGEENVEIQNIIDRKLIENVINDLSTRRFLVEFSFCLPKDYDFEGYNWIDYYENYPDEFEAFLKSITSENLKKF